MGLDVHRPEDGFQHFVCVGAISLAHLFNGLAEKPSAVEDTRVFCEEAKNQPRHEVIHVSPALVLGPIGIFAQQLHIELVQSPCGSHINRVVLNLLDGGDAGQRQEEPEVVWEIHKVCGDGFPCDELFSLKRLTIRRQNELGFGLGSGWT